MKTHRNIPVFIPHLGCPNLCVFCNQRTISGTKSFDPGDAEREIARALTTIPPQTECEIAYFGGSFTGIDRGLMCYLLDVAQKYIDRPEDGMARIIGIRMSTRPDYISDEIINILSRYTVKTVELGIQSMDDRVLRASKRGHSAQQTVDACKLIKAAGYELIGQMMIGLPGATLESEVETARAICDMGAVGARIYPTVVFRDTDLCGMAQNGEYKPLELGDAVERSKNALAVFDAHGVECIRLGLCASDNLSDMSQVWGGCNHPAIGDMVYGEMYYDKIKNALEGMTNILDRATVVVTVSHGNVSRAVGQHRCNSIRLCKEFGLACIKVREGDAFSVSTV